MQLSNSSSSYLGYLDIASRESGSGLMDHPDDIIRNVFGEINLNSPLAPVVLLSDFTTKDFVFAHKGCKSLIGYSSKYMTDAGLESFLEKIHEDDFKKVNGEIFNENFRVLQQITVEEMYNYIFTHSYRIKTIEGKYCTILQRVSYLLSPDNKPIGAIGHIADVTMVDNGEKMIHRIERINNEESKKSKEIIYQKYFYHDAEKKVISKREIEILKWISDGLSSKEIAVRLHISANTVNNHRKKMLQKTNCKNTAGLLKYVASHHIL